MMISARSSTPPPAPPPKEKYLWAKAVDANGDKYYYNKVGIFIFYYSKAIISRFLFSA